MKRLLSLLLVVPTIAFGGLVTGGGGSGGGTGDALTTSPLSQFASTTSAQLAGVISNETGTGLLTFATSPTFTTPVLGAATATSINGNTVTTGMGTLTLGSVTLNAGTGGTLGSGAFTSAGTSSLTPQQFDSYQYLLSVTDQNIIANRFTFTGGTISGKFGYAAGATYSGGEYIRDLAMLFRNRPEFISPTDLKGQIDLFYAVKAGSGAIRDSVLADGVTAGDSGSNTSTSIDNQYEWIDLIYTHYLKTGLPTLYHTYAANSGITNALAYPAITNHLVNIANGGTAATTKVGWGFQDSTYTYGYELMTSLERYRALNQLATMATADSDSATAATYLTDAGLVQSNLRTQLWDNTTGLFKNASGQNTQHSIPGSAYAVVLNQVYPGLLLAADQTAIINYLITNRYSYTQNGQISNLPSGENWTSGGTVGAYQNGGYWATHLGWVAEAIAVTNQTEADKAISEWVTYLRTQTQANIPIEWSNTSPSGSGSNTYLTSACMPVEAYRGRTIPYLPSPLYAQSVSIGGYSDPTFPGLEKIGKGGFTAANVGKSYSIITAPTGQNAGFQLSRTTNSDAATLDFVTGSGIDFSIQSRASDSNAYFNLSGTDRLWFKTNGTSHIKTATDVGIQFRSFVNNTSGVMLNAVTDNEGANINMEFGANKFMFSFGGVVSGTDNTYDLGASGANRFRDLFLARNAVIGGTINGNTFTTGTYTLTGAAAKTLTFSNSLTLAGTDTTTMTFPTTSATIARTDAANTFTGHQTIEGVTSTGATGTGKFVFSDSASHTGILFNDTLVVSDAFEIYSDAAGALARTSTKRGATINHNGYYGKSGYLYNWTSGSGSGADGGNPANSDTGLARNAAGVVEVNSGTAGTLRDLKVRGATVGTSNGVIVNGIRHGISGAMVLGTVTVTDAGCTANTRYFFSAHALGTISIPGGYYASTRNAGTSFVITSSQATETSTIDWMAIEP